jgi:hypothetical protein
MSPHGHPEDLPLKRTCILSGTDRFGQISHKAVHQPWRHGRGIRSRRPRTAREPRFEDAPPGDCRRCPQHRPLQARDPSFASSTPQFLLSPKTHVSSLDEGVAGTCPVSWSGSDGVHYNCPSPTKLTPITITFDDGKCPWPSCTLSCPSGKCLVQLDYQW